MDTAPPGFALSKCPSQEPLMNRMLSFSVALSLLSSIPWVNPSAPSGRLEQANDKLRVELTQAMLEGAAEHGIKILSDSIVFASRHDGMIANSMVAGFSDL